MPSWMNVLLNQSFINIVDKIRKHFDEFRPDEKVKVEDNSKETLDQKQNELDDFFRKKNTGMAANILYVVSNKKL